MRVCSSCGRENPDDRDFCECGEYLRWDPTGIVQAVTPETLQAAQQQVQPAAETPAARGWPAARQQPAAPQRPQAPGPGPPRDTPQQPPAQPAAAPPPAASPAPPAAPVRPGNGAPNLQSGDPLASAPP